MVPEISKENLEFLIDLGIVEILPQFLIKFQESIETTIKILEIMCSLLNFEKKMCLKDSQVKIKIENNLGISTISYLQNHTNENISKLAQILLDEYLIIDNDIQIE